MKPKTILNVMVTAHFEYAYPKPFSRRHRQFLAFRSRILRMFAEKDEDLEMEKLRFDLEVAENMVLKEQLVAKDTRIVALEETLKWSKFATEHYKGRVEDKESSANDYEWNDIDD